MRFAYSLLSFLFCFRLFVIFISPFGIIFGIALNFYFMLVFFVAKLVDRNIRVKVKCHYFFPREFFSRIFFKFSFTSVCSYFESLFLLDF